MKAEGFKVTATVCIAAVTFITLTASILFFPKIKVGKLNISTYWVIALIGAVAFLIGGRISFNDVIDGLTASSGINPLKILALFFSMTFISVVLDELGLFRLLAKRAVQSANGSQRFLFVVLYFLVALLTVVTSNDVVILTFTPFICFFCKSAKISPLPYLVSQFAAANTWSMMLIIGNPTNVYLATSERIGFIPYLETMVLPTLAAGIVEFAVIYLLFAKKLKEPLTPQRDRFKPESKVELIIGVIFLAICLIFLVVSGYVGVEMWMVSVGCAGLLAVALTILRLIRKAEHTHLIITAKRLPWQLIPFVLSMFVMVVALQKQGVAALIGGFLGDTATVWTYGAASYLSANLINNIPMSILFSALPAGLDGAARLGAIYASVVGSNVGAFLTPIGALAGIMFTELTEKHGVKFGFRQFITYGAIISVPTLTAALAVLSLVL